MYVSCYMTFRNWSVVLSFRVTSYLEILENLGNSKMVVKMLRRS